MNTLNKYIIITLAIFFILLTTFIYLVSNNILAGISNIVAVLIGSSLTASLALFIESLRINKEDNEVAIAIYSELQYNIIELEVILKDLQTETARIDKVLESVKLKYSSITAETDLWGKINLESVQLKYPLMTIKTDLWDFIKTRIDKNLETKNLIALIITIEYINNHLKIRDEYLTKNLGNNNINYKTLKEIDSQIIKNTENTIKPLNELLKLC